MTQSLFFTQIPMMQFLRMRW
uniref:Uncharacterized protein n=1 Tax=Anguilla anguilla TaxID=7936 RepID=A0A0E9XDQ5_ANGAN